MAKMLAREAMQPVLDLRDHKSFRTEKWLVQALYATGKENKVFLHTRFGLGNDVLEPYKATHSRWVCPDMVRTTRAIELPRPKRRSRTIKKPLAMPRGWPSCRPSIACPAGISSDFAA